MGELCYIEPDEPGANRRSTAITIRPRRMLGGNGNGGSDAGSLGTVLETGSQMSGVGELLYIQATKSETNSPARVMDHSSRVPPAQSGMRRSNSFNKQPATDAANDMTFVEFDNPEPGPPRSSARTSLDKRLDGLTIVDDEFAERVLGQEEEELMFVEVTTSTLSFSHQPALPLLLPACSPTCLPLLLPS